ncbi:pentapeptide MXKDX repeat protein [Chamaesiphon sp.]|uniref:pentapeptide MXKDX repeat protein n=1 Tax=Chamaesiphon sp. TaxID=2814140 RepID=UPI003593D0BA
MKLATVFAGIDRTKNWKVLVLLAGLILFTTLTSCSTTPTATPDATQQGDAMKDKGDGMKGDAMKDKGDAMKGDAMKDKGGAMKGDAKPTPTTKP